jgi:hypothetical protein
MIHAPHAPPLRRWALASPANPPNSRTMPPAHCRPQINMRRSAMAAVAQLRGGFTALLPERCVGQGSGRFEVLRRVK